MNIFLTALHTGSYRNIHSSVSLQFINIHKRFHFIILVGDINVMGR